MKYEDLEKLEDEKIKKLIDDALIIYKNIVNTELKVKFFNHEISLSEKVVVSIILSLYVNDFEGEFSKNGINAENILCGLENLDIEKVISSLTESSKSISEKERESLFSNFNLFFQEFNLSEKNINFEKLVYEILDDIEYGTFIEHICGEKVLKIIEKYTRINDKNKEESIEDIILKNLVPPIDFGNMKDDTKEIPLEIFATTPFGLVGSFNNKSFENRNEEKTKNDKKRGHINKNPFFDMFGMQPSFLDKNGINLNEKEYKYDPAIGREDIIRKCAITLETPTKSVLLVGPNGVGKSAIVEGLAKGIIDGKFLENYEIIEISASSLISGKGIMGSFQEGIENLLREIEERGNIILFIDEIHQIYEMGVSESNVMNMFKKPISEGKLKLIGATTKNEYDNTLKYDSAFVDRFDVYEISELKESIVKDIIIQRINFLEEYYDICFPFDNRDTFKFADYLIKITDKENRRLNQITYNPRLVIQLLDTIFAVSKVNKHKVVEKEDIVEAISSNTKIKSQRYSMPKFCYDEKEKPKILNNVIDFNSYINTK